MPWLMLGVFMIPPEIVTIIISADLSKYLAMDLPLNSVVQALFIRYPPQSLLPLHIMYFASSLTLYASEVSKMENNENLVLFAI